MLTLIMQITKFFSSPQLHQDYQDPPFFPALECMRNSQSS